MSFLARWNVLHLAWKTACTKERKRERERETPFVRKIDINKSSTSTRIIDLQGDSKFTNDCNYQRLDFVTCIAIGFDGTRRMLVSANEKNKGQVHPATNDFSLHRSCIAAAAVSDALPPWTGVERLHRTRWDQMSEPTGCSVLRVKVQ